METSQNCHFDPVLQAVCRTPKMSFRTECPENRDITSIITIDFSLKDTRNDKKALFRSGANQQMSAKPF
jgi:hypothetical protein